MGFFNRIGRESATGDSLSTPGETPVISPPTVDATTPLFTRAPYYPAGIGSNRGVLAGGSFARGTANITNVGTELIDHRTEPQDLAVIDPNMFVNSKPSATVTRRYRPGTNWTTFYRINAQRQWGVMPFYSNHHGKIRRDVIRSSTQNDGASGGYAGRQTAHGNVNPVVARNRPMPWDSGIIRGGV